MAPLISEKVQALREGRPGPLQRDPEDERGRRAEAEGEDPQVRPDHPRAVAGPAVGAAAGAGGEAPAPDRRHQEQQGHPGNEPERLRARGQRRAARDLRRHPAAGDLLPLRRQGLLFIQISQQIQESSETEKLLLKIDTIKKCLQVDSVDEFNILINDIHKRQQQFLVEEQNIINQNILEDSLLKDNVIIFTPRLCF